MDNPDVIYGRDFEEEAIRIEEIIGEMGIEKQYNSLLKGEDGYKTYQKDLRGYKIADTEPIIKDATQGKDIYLTIDGNIQTFYHQKKLRNMKKIT